MNVVGGVTERSGGVADRFEDVESRYRPVVDRFRPVVSPSRPVVNRFGAVADRLRAVVSLFGVVTGQFERVVDGFCPEAVAEENGAEGPHSANGLSGVGQAADEGGGLDGDVDHLADETGEALWSAGDSPATGETGLRRTRGRSVRGETPQGPNGPVVGARPCTP